MTQAELAALQIEKGVKRKGYGDPDLVDAVVDVHGLSLCSTCLEGLIPVPNLMGSAVEGTPGNCPRAWWFERKLTDAERAAILDYFEHPGCTAQRHAAFEARILDDAEWEVHKATAKHAEIARRPAGWSLEESK